MKGLLIGLLLGILVLPCVYAEVADISSQASIAPLLLPVTPGGSDSHQATRYPDFYAWDLGNKACGEYVDQHYSLRRIARGDGEAPDNYYDYYIDLDEDGNEVFTYLPQDSEYKRMAGMSQTIDFSADGPLGLNQYKRSARIIATWTVRIEGSISVRELWRKHEPWYCPGWVGKSYQRFPSGDAYTRIFVNGQAMGSPATMTVPTAGEGVSSGKTVDPNITGTLTLTPDMFEGGEFPDTLSFKIKWYNDTSMNLTAEDRNFFITITPTL